MEIGSHQDPSGLQRTSHRFYTTVVITVYSQTELVINTHVAVAGTHAMVLDIHRTIVQGQEGNDGKLSVSNIRTPAITEWLLIIPQAQTRSVI